MNLIYQRYFHRYLQIIVLCFSLVSFNSCNYCKNLKVRMMIKHEYGKVLDFSWPGSQIMPDTILQGFELNKPITIVSYIDDKLCPECFANYLRAAEKYVNQFNSDNVQYVCIAYPRPIDKLQYAITLAGIDSSKIMVVYDLENHYQTYNSIDKIPSGYNVFLIDKNHKIVLLGDPIRSQSMYDLCKTQIRTMLDEL